MDASVQILKELCSVPTAPFAEHAVVKYVEQFVAARPRIGLSQDSFGNLLLFLKGTSPSPRWVFAAHMDHPGFVSMATSGTTLTAAFRGYVLTEYFKNAKVRFFTDAGEVRGVVTRVKVGKERGVPEMAAIRVETPVPPGCPGMFDLGAGRVTGHCFVSRVCDDLAGAAAALAMLDALARRPAAAPVAVLLTRAEEEGFIGAIAAATQPRLLRKTDRLVAIECSAAQPYAPLGNGAVIRVGDRTSIFNSSLTWFLTQQAAQLAKNDKSFRYQRALMPGGTCEATVYDAYGFHASSICVPLGNYHNMDRGKQKLAAEFIDINDWKSMVKLFLRIARRGHTYEPGMAALKRRWEKRFAKLKPLL